MIGEGEHDADLESLLFAAVEFRLSAQLSRLFFHGAEAVSLVIAPSAAAVVAEQEMRPVRLSL